MAEAFLAKHWRDLIKPRRLDVDQDSLTQTYGKFVDNCWDVFHSMPPMATGLDRQLALREATRQPTSVPA